VSASISLTETGQEVNSKEQHHSSVPHQVTPQALRVVRETTNCLRLLQDRLQRRLLATPLHKRWTDARIRKNNDERRPRKSRDAKISQQDRNKDPQTNSSAVAQPPKGSMTSCQAVCRSALRGPGLAISWWRTRLLPRSA